MRDDMPPADGSSTVAKIAADLPLVAAVAKLQASSVPIA